MSGRIYPCNFIWREVDIVDSDGATERLFVMIPENRYEGIARRQYHDGESYPLVILEARSRASHNAYFAEVHSGYDNLPESFAKNFPNAEYLRKYLLVETGWFEDDVWHLTTKKEATELAARTRTREPYARLKIFETSDDEGTRCWALRIRRAVSQSAAAMGKQQFEKSKRDVLDLLTTLIETTPAELRKNAGRS
jgi:hypothetical protein